LKEMKDDEYVKRTYVSLYGKNELNQIDEEIFQKLHPFLGSKGVKLLGAVAKGILKTTTNINLGSGETISINSQLPDVKLGGLFPTPNDCVIVFDDLERCSIDITDLLGYINSFVEHEGVKVIVLADGGQFVNRSDYDKYKIIKEKTIGKTLEV